MHVEDDEPRVEVPSRVLALLLSTIPCEHEPDTVCHDCSNKVYDYAFNILYPLVVSCDECLGHGYTVQGSSEVSCQACGGRGVL
jgi:hypothetical protein